MPVLPQKIERKASYARECLMNPGLTPEVSLFRKCPKMQSVSAPEARMLPNPALTGRACWIDTDVRVRMSREVLAWKRLGVPVTFGISNFEFIAKIN
jgi:hypothetical protein